MHFKENYNFDIEFLSTLTDKKLIKIVENHLAIMKKMEIKNEKKRKNNRITL